MRQATEQCAVGDVHRGGFFEHGAGKVEVVNGGEQASGRASQDHQCGGNAEHKPSRDRRRGAFPVGLGHDGASGQHDECAEQWQAVEEQCDDSVLDDL